jgi:hypothetical protein
VSSSSYIVSAIRSRATVLRLISGFTLGRVEAEQRAAKELASERRASAKPSTASVSPTAEPTSANARQLLIARIDAVAQRLKDAPRRRARLRQSDMPTVLPHVLDPISPQPAPVAAAPELNVAVAVGVFVGQGSGTRELIDDSEFHTSVSFGDRATNNWRRSIAENERIQQRRRGLYVG